MIKITKLMHYGIATGAALLFAGTSMAGDDKCVVIDDKCPVECCKEDPSWCGLFKKSTLYKNEENCFVQKVSLAGRYHGQYLGQSIDHSSGQSFGSQYWEHRRFRLGAKVQFLNDFTFFNNWNIGDSNEQGENLAAGDFFGTIDEMYIKWEPSNFAVEGFYVTVGKQKQKITREFSTSSKQILTFERSHIVNETTDTKAWGVATGFKALGLKHEVGAWLGGFDESADGSGPNWADFDSRGGASYRAEYGLNDNTDIHFDYLFSNNSNGDISAQGNADALALSNYNHVIALGTESSWDLGHCDRKFGLITDVIWGRDRTARSGNEIIGAGSNDAAAGQDTTGFVIMPYIDLTERLQLVGKYAYADFARMQRTQRRAFERNGESRPVMEDVHTLYLGLNYRLCGDNLKLMAGYEYLSADMFTAPNSVDQGSLTGDSWMLGIRTYF
ncbi:MAG: porin [Verrucomicrobiales bacterium]|nr:porin [Verrucomicrobiales bacterium]